MVRFQKKHSNGSMFYDVKKTNLKIWFKSIFVMILLKNKKTQTNILKPICNYFNKTK